MVRCWFRSAIRAWGCHRSTRTRSLMRSLPPKRTAPVWDFGSAAPLLNRTAAAYGLRTIPRAAQRFSSPCPQRPRRTHNLLRRSRLLQVLDNMCCKSISAHNRPPSSQATFTKTVQLAPHYVGLYLLPLLRPWASRQVFMSYRGLSTDPLFVCRLKHLAAARSACLKHAGKEVAISIFVEDQFVLVWSVVSLGFPYLEESGGISVYAADFHNTEIRIVERVHAVVACGKFGVPRMELERDCNFEIISHLRLGLTRMNSNGED